MSVRFFRTDWLMKGTGTFIERATHASIAAQEEKTLHRSSPKPEKERVTYVAWVSGPQTRAYHSLILNHLGFCPPTFNDCLTCNIVDDAEPIRSQLYTAIPSAHNNQNIPDIHYLK